MTEDRRDILEEEIIILQNSGEIPEIALHTTLHYLTQDKQGPEIVLNDEELQSLYDAADQRYREIVLRDLNPENRDLRIYRGVARTIANWQRYQKFCCRINRDLVEFKTIVRNKAHEFIVREYQDVSKGLRNSSVNCCIDELGHFLQQIEIELGFLPENWQVICPDKT